MARRPAPRIPDLGWQEQQELETVLRRFSDLTPRAQLEVFALIRNYLDGEVAEIGVDRAIAKRRDALEVLRRVAADLELPKGEAPTTTQFREASKRLGLGWSVAKVGRAWGKWRFACEAYTGHHLRRTAVQQAVLNANTGKKRAQEDYVTSLRLWLDTSPVAETITAYDKWAQEFNEVLPHNQPPACLWSPIHHNLRVGFHDALRVARNEVALSDCVKSKGDHTKEHGPLVSKQWMQGEYGLSAHRAANLPRSPQFPKPIVMLSRRRAWLKDDVRAYFENRPFPKRKEFELQDEYLSLAELAALMGKKPRMISQTTRLPEPAGLVSLNRYWLRSEVEQWQRTENSAKTISRKNGMRRSRTPTISR
jgi:predicted DNA-binding transcriptional regulator AlpA